MNLGSEPGGPADRLIAALERSALAGGIWRPETLPHGGVVFAQGDENTALVVLQKGLVKLAYITADGRERAKSFVIDRGLFAGGEPGDADGTCAYGATCLEASVIVRLPVAFVTTAAARDPETATAIAAFRAWLLSRKLAREAALLCDSAEDRYRALCADTGPTLSRIPQGDLARWLGITPVAFSRIKRRLRRFPAA